MQSNDHIWNMICCAVESTKLAGLWETAFAGSKQLFLLSFAFLGESIGDVYYTFHSNIFSAVNRKTQGGL